MNPAQYKTPKSCGSSSVHRTVPLILAILCAFLLGLGGFGMFSARQSDPESVASRFLQSFHNGDILRLRSYMTEDLYIAFDAPYLLGDEATNELSTNSIDQFQKRLNQLYSYSLEEYEMGIVYINGAEASVDVEVSGVSLDAIKPLLEEDYLSETTTELMIDFIDNKGDILEDYLVSHTDDEGLDWIYDQILPDLGRRMCEKADSEKRIQSSWQLGLIKEGDRWLVDEIHYE